MHLFLHILKFAFEGTTIIAIVAAIAVLFMCLIPDNAAMDMEAYVDIVFIGILLVIAVVTFLAWWALVHFAHLPWWK